MLKMMPGSLKIGPQSLMFRSKNEEQEIACSILAQALDDLIGFHGIDAQNDQSADQILELIERIVNDKIDARRVEPNGEIVIRSIDILRYGTNPFGQDKANGDNPA